MKKITKKDIWTLEKAWINYEQDRVWDIDTKVVTVSVLRAVLDNFMFHKCFKLWAKDCICPTAKGKVQNYKSRKELMCPSCLDYVEVFGGVLNVK